MDPGIIIWCQNDITKRIMNDIIMNDIIYLFWWKGTSSSGRASWWSCTLSGGGAVWWFVGTLWHLLNISFDAFILAFKSSNSYSYLHRVSTLWWSCLSWSDLRPPYGFKKNSVIPTSWPLAWTRPEYSGVPKAWLRMSLVPISINSPLSRFLRSASYKKILKMNSKHANK